MATKISEFINNISDPMVQRSLQAIWEAVDVEINALRTLANELRADHATQKTSHDAAETLIEELHDDHATLITWQAEVDGDLDEINDYLHYMNERDGVIGGDFSLTAGAATTLTGAGRIRYRIAGIEYETVLDTTITLEDNGDVTQSKWGAWRLLIDATGTVTTQDTAGSGSMAHDSAIDALLSLSQRAQTAGTIEFGYMTIVDTDSVFNIGTDNLNASGATATVYTVHQPRLATGLDTALGSSVVADSAANTWSVGTIDHHRLGVSATQIGAISNQAMDDADTIATTKFGGWLLVTDPVAGTAVYALATDGKAGAVTAMTHADVATRDTALDTVEARLPATCAVVGRILVENGSGGTFTAGTTNWDATDMTTTVEDAVFATHDRTDTVGAQHGIDAPAIPATVNAAMLGTLGSAKPASGPGTISATAVSDSLEGQ